MAAQPSIYTKRYLFLFPCSSASWTNEFLIATAGVAGFTVHLTLSFTDRASYRFEAMTCLASHII
jgi:hypothetical protein